VLDRSVKPVISRLRSVVTQTGKRVERLLQSRALILAYHRITRGESDPWALNVTPAHFSEHLDVLRRCLRPMPLAELEHARRCGRIPHGAVAVTFDDGYADNLHTAAPMLARADVPATVFVTTGAIGSTRGFWWDELDQIVLGSTRLPRLLEMTIAGRPLSWQAADLTARDPENSKSGRRQLYQQLWDALRELQGSAQEDALDNVRAWAGAVAQSAHRPMSAHEVVTLAQQPLIDVGAHTVSHPQLATLPGDRQRDEIHASRAQLEKLIGRTVAHFAYPHGSYAKDTIAEVKRAGYTCACSSRQTAVVRSTDAYELPRISILDWDGERFAREVSRWIPLRRC
jgi:peptidoglycan/xylan/chitin deacetylase (PgdA/CDA1 family)